MHGNPSLVTTLRRKAISEIRRLITIFIYLSVFFFVFRLYTRLILSEFRVNYVEYGLTLLKALILAKLILTADALRFGSRFRDHALIVPTIYNTVVFVLFATVIEIVEHFAVGAAIHGKSPAAVFAEIQEQGWPHLGAMYLVVFVAFLPFFAFREMERVLGEGKVRDMFLLRPRSSEVPQPQSAGD